MNQPRSQDNEKRLYAYGQTQCHVESGVATSGPLCVANSHLNVKQPAKQEAAQRIYSRVTRGVKKR